MNPQEVAAALADTTDDGEADSAEDVRNDPVEDDPTTSPEDV